MTSTAPRPEERSKRRGIAGDLAVFRAAAWAAEQGFDLDAVAAVAARANDRTRSFGVAFTGCTLPGAREPLFTVPAGQMAVGMGIHGEPGIDIRPLPTAGRTRARCSSPRCSRSAPKTSPPPDGARVAVILNGLGAVKSEELFVIYGTVAAAARTAGIVVVEPEVGEFATSFEMAGVSLTLFWLDDELEAAWASPTYAAAYRKGAMPVSTAAAAVDAVADEVAAIAHASEESVAAGDHGAIGHRGDPRRDRSRGGRARPAGRGRRRRRPRHRHAARVQGRSDRGGGGSRGRRRRRDRADARR